MTVFDSAWKDMIREHFFSFLGFYFPELAGEMDYSRGLAFLDKELKRILPRNRSPDRYADLLVKAGLRGGEEQILYCHIEVQGRKTGDFSLRLFQYAYRIFDRFGQFPATLVVLTDDDPGFYPERFIIDGPGVYVEVEFLVAKLLYLKERAEEMRRFYNPFAFVTEAQLEVNALQRRRGSKRKSDKSYARYELKKRLILKLLRAGFNENEVLSLLRFLDWILQLPQKEEEKLIHDIKTNEGGDSDMTYISSWERIAQKRGMERGLEQGIEKGVEKGIEKGYRQSKQNILVRLLDKKFSLTPEEESLIREIEDTTALDEAIDSILTAESKEEVLGFLKQR